MKTSGSNFDLIMQELLNQKHILEELEAENQELRRQLADLREGKDIFVEILGRRFSLSGEPPVTSHEEEIELPPPMQSIPVVEDAPTTLIEAFPLNSSDLEDPQIEEDEKVEEEAVSFTPAFLEEMLLDEFTSASTNPIAVWTAPGAKKEEIKEEDKEVLRRELMGSYLLE